MVRFAATHKVIASRKGLDTLMYVFPLVSRLGPWRASGLLAAALCKQGARLRAFSSVSRWLTKGHRVLARWMCGGLIMSP